MIEQPAVVSRAAARWPGRTSLGLGVLTAILVAVGVVIASAGEVVGGFVVAWMAFGVSAFGVVFGLVAIIGRWGRPAGIAGVVLSIVANPFLLTATLNALGGL